MISRENWMVFPEVQAYVFANLLKIIKYGQMGHLVLLASISDELSAVIKNYTGE